MAERTWLEVSLTVNGEMAEAVAEVLSRYIPDGVVIESTAVRAGPADENGEAVGPLRVCGYIPGDANQAETRQKIEQGLWYLGRISTLPDPEYKTIHEVNWMEAWKENYRPIPVGDRLVILPAWFSPSDDSRIPVRIELGMAFGTGTHPTTQMCLQLVEDYFDVHQGKRGLTSIDIGCGSSILSIAALKLGAEKALGVDIDQEAIRASEQNASLNSVLDRLELGIGSVKEVKAGKFEIYTAPLVLANILAPVLIDLLNQGLGDIVLEDGWLVLSGILAEQSLGVEVALADRGFSLVNKLQTGDWVALAAQK